MHDMMAEMASIHTRRLYGNLFCRSHLFETEAMKSTTKQLVGIINSTLCFCLCVGGQSNAQATTHPASIN